MLHYHKLHVTLKPSTIHPHRFIGSTLRGAFGVSLKKVVCINPSYRCEGCFAKESCLYYRFYEERNRAHQYRFDFALDPGRYDFSLYLFEEATDQLPYVVSAIHKMFTQQGIGIRREKIPIDTITCNDKIIYQNGKFDLGNIPTQEFVPDTLPQSVSLEFVTPLRMKQQGRLLTAKPPLETLLYSIHNRLAEIKNLPRTKITFQPEYSESRSFVRFTDQTRRSNRQKQKLQIGGITGSIDYDYVDEKSLIYLKLGEILGVGKQTVFGMGKIALKNIETTDNVA